jgi:hypothetical protein
MKQKIFLYVEEGVGVFDDLDDAMKVKQNLNNVGIRARVRMKTPNFPTSKSREWLQGKRSYIVIKPSKPAR